DPSRGRKSRRARREITLRRSAFRRRDVELAVFELRDVQEALLRGLEAELRELGDAEVLLVEGAVDLLHHLLQAVRAHHISVALHPADRLGDQLPRIELPGVVGIARLYEAGERVVAVV